MPNRHSVEMLSRCLVSCSAVQRSGPGRVYKSGSKMKVFKVMELRPSPGMSIGREEWSCEKQTLRHSDI